MRVDISPTLDAVVVRISRRNIESLLHMLDNRDKAMPALVGRDGGVEILVTCEEDDEHYADRPAGTMSWER